MGHEGSPPYLLNLDVIPLEYDGPTFIVLAQRRIFGNFSSGFRGRWGMESQDVGRQRRNVRSTGPLSHPQINGADSPHGLCPCPVAVPAQTPPLRESTELLKPRKC